MAHPVFSVLIEVEDDNSSPASSPDQYIEVPDISSEEIITPAEAYDSELISQYSPERLRFIQDCSKKTRSKCGVEVFKNMVLDRPVSRDCCKDLLNIGQDCHLVLVQFIFSTYEVKHTPSLTVARSKQTWNTCVKMVGDEMGAPVSLET
ncbi:PREDICTED: uncharacterized protein LOC104810160 [Tarenaya hassleriana]|uniref:uncharacterized protein LOC104810160 n=1 Tax=Tarenaya hassleriana TaxID=28532 RepID=UPI00053C5E72|nr:PREDICTED: uncharacterized protein LOC104810160 [Tarenaya hassleriana]